MILHCRVTTYLAPSIGVSQTSPFSISTTQCSGMIPNPDNWISCCTSASCCPTKVWSWNPQKIHLLCISKYFLWLHASCCFILTVFTWNKGIIFQSLVWNKQENLKSGAVRKLPTVTRVQSVESGVLFEYCYPETQENSKPVYKMPSTLLGHVQDQLTLSSSNLS